jgi:hypothetical protein
MFFGVSRDDIGDHMRQYAVDHDIMSKPRKSLVGSMFGEKIMVISPLLKWYVEHRTGRQNSQSAWVDPVEWSSCSSPLRRSWHSAGYIYGSKSLVGSMFGEKIMVISPLLKWYVEHGLKVTQIHQVELQHPELGVLVDKTANLHG